MRGTLLLLWCLLHASATLDQGPRQGRMLDQGLSKQAPTLGPSSKETPRPFNMRPQSFKSQAMVKEEVIRHPTKPWLTMPKPKPQQNNKLFNTPTLADNPGKLDHQDRPDSSYTYPDMPPIRVKYTPANLYNRPYPNVGMTEAIAKPFSSENNKVKVNKSTKPVKNGASASSSFNFQIPNAGSSPLIHNRPNTGQFVDLSDENWPSNEQLNKKKPIERYPSQINGQFPEMNENKKPSNEKFTISYLGLFADSSNENQPSKGQFLNNFENARPTSSPYGNINVPISSQNEDPGLRFHNLLTNTASTSPVQGNVQEIVQNNFINNDNPGIPSNLIPPKESDFSEYAIYNLAMLSNFNGKKKPRIQQAASNTVYNSIKPTKRMVRFPGPDTSEYYKLISQPEFVEQIPGYSFRSNPFSEMGKQLKNIFMPFLSPNWFSGKPGSHDTSHYRSVENFPKFSHPSFHSTPPTSFRQGMQSEWVPIPSPPRPIIKNYHVDMTLNTPNIRLVNPNIKNCDDHSYQHGSVPQQLLITPQRNYKFNPTPISQFNNQGQQVSYEITHGHGFGNQNSYNFLPSTHQNSPPLTFNYHKIQHFNQNVGNSQNKPSLSFTNGNKDISFQNINHLNIQTHIPTYSEQHIKEFHEQIRKHPQISIELQKENNIHQQLHRPIKNLHPALSQVTPPFEIKNHKQIEIPIPVHTSITYHGNLHKGSQNIGGNTETKAHSPTLQEYLEYLQQSNGEGNKDKISYPLNFPGYGVPAQQNPHHGIIKDSKQPYDGEIPSSSSPVFHGYDKTVPLNNQQSNIHNQNLPSLSHFPDYNEFNQQNNNQVSYIPSQSFPGFNELGNQNSQQESHTSNSIPPSFPGNHEFLQNNQQGIQTPSPFSFPGFNEVLQKNKQQGHISNTNLPISQNQADLENNKQQVIQNQHPPKSFSNFTDFSAQKNEQGFNDQSTQTQNPNTNNAAPETQALTGIHQNANQQTPENQDNGNYYFGQYQNSIQEQNSQQQTGNFNHEIPSQENSQTDTTTVSIQPSIETTVQNYFDQNGTGDVDSKNLEDNKVNPIVSFNAEYFSHLTEAAAQKSDVQDDGHRRHIRA